MDENNNMYGNGPEYNAGTGNAQYSYDFENEAARSNQETDNSGYDQFSNESQNSTFSGNEQTCANCGESPVVEGYSIPLCYRCREHLIKYPVPVPVKIFALIVLLVFTFSMLSFPKSLKAGIAYERGLRAESEKKFIRAANEYQKVVEIFPNSFIACGKLFVTHVKNHNFDQAAEVFAMIEGKESKDSDEIVVIDEANEALEFLDGFFSFSDALYEIVERNESLESTSKSLKQYVDQNPLDHWGHYYYAQVLFDLKLYEAAKAEYLKAVELKPEIHEFRLGAAAAYRQTGEISKAIEQCNIVLSENAEFPEAFVSLSKIDLKCRRYDDALENAKKAFAYESTNPNAIATLALACHFNKMDDQRDELLNILLDYDKEYYDYAIEIISGESDLFN